MEKIILVDEQDNQIGEIEKLPAHENGGQLHRAFSIFVFNSRGQLLLQERAKTKYHGGGWWTNTCCSHPRVGEKIEESVHRRLVEEMGFDCELKEEFSFIYKATCTNELTEWEFDHVFIGKWDGEVKPNPEEADSFKWVSKAEILKDVKENPDKYSPWFKIALNKVLERV